MKTIMDIVLKAIAIVSFFSIPIGFIFSGSAITAGLQALLKLKVDPRFNGGTEMARVYDPTGDDNGDGRLGYPRGPLFQARGIFDLVKYTVFQPELDAAWSDQRQFWQLAVTLLRFENPHQAPNGFSLCSIRIYIDTGGGSGSTETAVPRAELVSFDPAAPWDVMVEIDGWHASAIMRTADGKIQRPVPIIAVPDQRTVYVRLPMDIPQVTRILDGRQTRHYVLVCGYDPLAVDNVMRVNGRATPDSAGGARSTLTPRVFDVLAPRAEDQQAQLGSYDEASFRYATLRPVTILPGTPALGAGTVDLEKLEAEAKKQAEMEKAAARSRAQADAASADPLRAGAGLFSLERLEEAEKTFRGVLVREPENPAALAYLGSITAMKGGRAGSPASAVMFVNDAFALLDRAVAAAKTDDEREIALMSRASVASAVPEAVFSKNAAAARDYLALADLAEARGEEARAGEGLVSAALSFERCSQKGQADIAFIRASGLKQLTAHARLELARRGYPIPTP
jgi:hypothetical protein